MQIIVRVNISVDQYVEDEFHKRIRVPNRCGNCGKFYNFVIHGYYERYTTNASGVVVSFKVARFKCKYCNRTMSCLPSFAHPYRLIANETIGAFIQGDINRIDVKRFEWLLIRYLKSFEQWSKLLVSITGSRFGRAPPKESATAFLRRAVAVCGSFTKLTICLIKEFNITCFRRYCCHQLSYC